MILFLKVWLWLTSFSFVCGVAAFIFWLFWWPLRLFLYSLIPVDAAYAWIGKLFIVIFVGYIGGVGIPLMILFFGIIILLAIAAQK